MARVALFTSQGCKHCRRAKALLAEKSIPYREVDVTRRTRESGDKTVLAAIQQFTGRRTVPQVFIAETCIGGADELYSLEETGELGRLLAAAEEKGQKALPSEVEEFVPDEEEEGDPFLRESGGGGEGAFATTKAADYDWDRYEALAERSRGLKKKLSGNVFSGERLVEALKGGEKAEGPARNEATIAIELGQELVAKRLVLCSGDHDEEFHGDASHFYSFPEELPADVFNGQMLWPADMEKKEKRGASEVAESLRLKILNLYEDFLSSDGNAVDYAGLGQSAKFRDYVRSTSELREVNLEPLSREGRIAFFVNIYNALVIHATAAVGAPSSVVKRVQFFSKIKYCIGGQLYSCDDMEHGILRNNAVSPASLLNLVGLSCLASRTFPDKKDPRRKLVVDPVDPRIHFALVCGAKSCPPIRLYSAANLEEGLAGAAEAFCESEVVLGRDKRTVTLSKIFKWYGKDFASTKVDLLLKIADFRGKREEEDEFCQIMRSNPNSLKIRYAEYNWDVNSK